MEIRYKFRDKDTHATTPHHLTICYRPEDMRLLGIWIINKRKTDWLEVLHEPQVYQKQFKEPSIYYNYERYKRKNTLALQNT